jgi:N-acetyl-anhydromuramyl-L-alanine amidase AmpD
MDAIIRDTPYKTECPRIIRGVVLHHTGTKIVVEPRESGSWHYIVDRDGTIYNDVPDEDVAWHTARTDRWKPAWVANTAGAFYGSAINSCTIGIELVCHPDFEDSRGYTQPQLKALYGLFDQFKKDHGHLWYLGHGMVQADRRPKEPEGFDWQGFEWDDKNGYKYVANPFVSEDRSNEVNCTCGPDGQAIIEAAKRHGLESADAVDQHVGRYNLLAEQVDSLHWLLEQAQKERDEALERARNVDEDAGT